LFKQIKEEKEDQISKTLNKSKDSGSNLDVMKRHFKHPESDKTVSDFFKTEIIEEGLIPNYNVSVPKFSDKERLIFNEVPEKLVEVAVSQGEKFRLDEGNFIEEVKEFLRSKGVLDVDRLATQISQEMIGYG
jgi:flagellar protein FlaI